MDYDRDKHKYEGFCTPLMNKLGYVNEEHKKFCLKLVRNLGRYSDDFKFQYFTSEYCTNLNNWVYDSKKKYNIPDNIIDNCFQDYIDYMTQIGAQPKCSYYSYDDIYEPINIIMLKIFESNVNVLISTLNQENNIFIPSCQNYVCELVKIYNYMNSILCAKGKEGDEKKEKTCDILKNFYDIYKWFFFVKLHNTNKIPSLDNIEAEYLDKCVPNERKQPLTPVDSETTYTVSSLSSDEYANPRKSPSQVPVNDENQGSSMSRTVSTAFGTVAGASSILALLYKVTLISIYIYENYCVIMFILHLPLIL
ncbi:hypothetical protein PVNG_02212 [Plasmodium vivax North Korean]|uniref:Variable surface protein n=1 Tax=Plasmodium vivax North Korean TaxID=1035514 RepID=A0A0J9TUU9_PLAVI|nr:hypothetical protein PVNG_02212 [Plasmodium vivax North Korean]